MPRQVKQVRRNELAPNQRFALIGKSGSGKTTFAVVLASLLVHPDDQEWQVWWIDTKGDPVDISRLKRWGFVSYGLWSKDTVGKYRGINRLYFRLAGTDDDSVVDQAQRIIALALQRRKVLLVIDEYTQVVISVQNAGKWLKDTFRTGRGLNVGVIGCTQEPVFVPRQLMSQANHVFLFDLFYNNDIKVAKSMYDMYDRPTDKHGFYHGYVDGRSQWQYYRNQQEWGKTVKFAGGGSTPTTEEQDKTNEKVGA